MSVIKELSEELINKIAAGEVIERPASVVKELIENSIDAGAKSISIDIEDAGVKKIQVVDDGCGMDKADLKLCVLRHATSKISREDELYQIGSLGFRGEALASIASVSRLKISSRQKGSDVGNTICIEGGKEKELKKEGMSVGTRTIVSDLFYNTPARKKYLKARSTELSHIIDIVTRYALNYPELSIRLRHNSKELLNSPGVSDHLNNIVSIYGKDIAKDLIPVEHYSGDIEIKGFISKPKLTRLTRDYQTVFVNGRYVKSKVISDAVLEGYGNLLFHGRSSVYVLDVKLSLADVDVNVHPSKIHIKLRAEDVISYNIKKAVSEVLMKSNPVQDVRTEELQEKLGLVKPKVSKKTPKRNYMFENSKQEELVKGEDKKYDEIKENEHTRLIKEDVIKPGKVISTENETKDFDNREFDKRKFDIREFDKKEFGINKEKHDFKIHGQVDKTYILVEDDQGLLIIDQHAAEERVNFEKFMKQYEDKKITKQDLLSPLMIEVSAKEGNILSAGKEKLSELGFEVEEFGHGTYVVRAIPSVMNKQQGKDFIFDMISEAEVSGKKVDELSYDKIASKSCRASIKAGDDMSYSSIKKLVNDLKNCEQGYTCPHGRPTMLRFSIRELEKMFKRVV